MNNTSMTDGMSAGLNDSYVAEMAKKMTSMACNMAYQLM